MFYDQQVAGTVACQLKWVGQTLGFVSLSAICLQQLALVWPQQQNMMNPTTKVSGQASFWWMNQFVWNWELQFICRMILTFKPSNIHVCLFVGKHHALVLLTHLPSVFVLLFVFGVVFAVVFVFLLVEQHLVFVLYSYLYFSLENIVRWGICCFLLFSAPISYANHLLVGS